MDAVRAESPNVDLVPWKWGDDELATDLQTHIEKLILRSRWLTWRERVMGARGDTHLELEFPSGYVHAILLESLANLAVGRGPDTPWTEQIGREIEMSVAPRLYAGPESVAALAKTQGWPAVLREGFAADRSPEGLELSELERQAEWPQATAVADHTRATLPAGFDGRIATKHGNRPRT